MSEMEVSPLKHKALALLLLLLLLGGCGTAAEIAATQAPAPTPTPVPTPLPTPEPTPAPVPSTLSLVAAGDNLLHIELLRSAYDESADRYDFAPFYEHLSPVLDNAGIACINQETIFIDEPTLYGGYPTFGSPPAAGQGLIDAGFDVVTQANNHSWDRVEEGILDTLDFWEAHPEICHVGLNRTETDRLRIRTLTENDITVSFLSYTYPFKSRYVTVPWYVPTLSDEEAIREEIALAREQSDAVVVFVHWGEEYAAEPNAFQRKWAQFFADEGVTAVIGSHPHVLQPMEYIRGRDGNEMLCYFSLGNFLSAQQGARQLLGGMASLVLEKDEDGCRIREAELLPTVTWIYRAETPSGLDFRAMLLKDYTDAMAERHTQGVTPQELWELFEPFA